MERVILHCDLNNFFASAALTVNPTLKQLPVAVCGDVEKRHGIVLAKNNIAKAYGVVTAETVWQAKQKCPDLITLAPDFALYERLSRQAQAMYYQYSNLVEPFGIDECWVDISDKRVGIAEGEQIAQDIRRRMKRELGLTISIGVSFNKVFAKLGSDMKKPDAVTVIAPDTFQKIVWPLPCADMLMIGRSTLKALTGMGIFTIGDLAQTDAALLERKLGKCGGMLKRQAMGQDNSPVQDYCFSSPPKSIGRSATAAYDLETSEQVFSAFLHFSEEVCRQLRRHRLLAKTVTITLVDHDFVRKECRKPLQTPTNLSMVMAECAMACFCESYAFEKPLRAVGVRAVQLVPEDGNAAQLSLFENMEDCNRLEQIEEQMLQIRQKYGCGSIFRAACMQYDTQSETPGFYKRTGKV